MKEFKRIGAIAAMTAVLICGCSTPVEDGEVTVLTPETLTSQLTEISNDEQTTTEASSEAAAESAAETTTEAVVETSAEETQAQTAEFDEAIIRNLVDENTYCLRNLYGATSLYPVGDPVQDDHIYKADTDRFADYAEFESYIRSVFCTKEAERLLFNSPYEGQPMYLNIDGMLCVDTYLAGAKGYYVDWSDYRVEIVSADSGRCEFIVTGQIEEPAEFPVKEDYPINGAVVFENGGWHLEKLIF